MSEAVGSTDAGQRLLGLLGRRTAEEKGSGRVSEGEIDDDRHEADRGVGWTSRRGSEHGADRSTKKGAVVSFADKVRNKAQELRGRIKRNTGEVTGDRRLQAEGRADEVKSNVKQAGEKVKDVFRGRGTRHRDH